MVGFRSDWVADKTCVRVTAGWRKIPAQAVHNCPQFWRSLTDSRLAFLYPVNPSTSSVEEQEVKGNTELPPTWSAPVMTVPMSPRIVLSRREYQRRVNLRRATHQWALRKTQSLIQQPEAMR